MTAPTSPTLVRQPDGSPVEPVVVDSTPFASLLHFRKAGAPTDEPKVLIAAPLSGHFATMLTPTVRTMLQDHDVYITDWHNARDVDRKHGRFGLDEYVDHLIRFQRVLGPGWPPVRGLPAVRARGDGRGGAGRAGRPGPAAHPDPDVRARSTPAPTRRG